LATLGDATQIEMNLTAKASKENNIMDKLQLTGQNLGRVFNFRFGHLHAKFWVLSSKTAKLKVENLAQTTSRFSTVSYRAPRQYHVTILQASSHTHLVKVNVS
jgi:hypothetical protein